MIGLSLQRDSTHSAGRGPFHSPLDAEPLSPGDYLERHPTNQQVTPCNSSWGLKGFSEQWLNETNAWTWPHLHTAGEHMVDLARRHAKAGELCERFNSLYLIAGEAIAEEVPTYRGQGRAFL